MSELLDYVLRILIAAGLGSVIGLERKLRVKEAGIRTHAIVAVGSALMMIVSKYGFADMGGDVADAGRIAAQIVSGVGFLGAGIIVYNRGALRGLTTAAGIWTTAGIGMCVGCGMVLLAVIVSGIVILYQCILHLPLRVFEPQKFQQIEIVFQVENPGDAEAFLEKFGRAQVVKCILRKEASVSMCTVVLVVKGEYSIKKFEELLTGCGSVQEIKLFQDS